MKPGGEAIDQRVDGLPANYPAAPDSARFFRRTRVFKIAFWLLPLAFMRFNTGGRRAVEESVVRSGEGRLTVIGRVPASSIGENTTHVSLVAQPWMDSSGPGDEPQAPLLCPRGDLNPHAP